MQKLFKLAAGGLVAAACAAPSAAVQTLNVTSAGIYDPAVVVASGTPSGSYNASAVRFTGTSAGGAFDIYAFCADLAHEVGVGFGSQAGVSYAYTVGRLTNDGFGNPLSAGQRQQMMGLARLGRQVALGRDADRALKLAAVQAAIWSVEYPGASFGGSEALNAQLSAYLALAPSLKGSARYLMSQDSPLRQQFLSAVPEPGTWATMIMGFALVGAAARRRVVATA